MASIFHWLFGNNSEFSKWIGYYKPPVVVVPTVPPVVVVPPVVIVPQPPVIQPPVVLPPIPEPPVNIPVPPIPPVIPPSGGIADMISISSIHFVGGPNIGSWPATAKITKVQLSSTGVHVDFTKKDGSDRWPDMITPGWTGPLQYSMGLALLINGVWYASAPIELWHDLIESGGPIQSQNIGDGRGQIQANWFYDARWAPLHEHQPAPGEMLGFFVCAGDPRNNFTPVKERSNIVLLKLPLDGQIATFTY